MLGRGTGKKWNLKVNYIVQLKINKQMLQEGIFWETPEQKPSRIFWPPFPLPTIDLPLGSIHKNKLYAKWELFMSSFTQDI